MKYHRDIGFPPLWRRPLGVEYLVPSAHAQMQARVRDISIPRTLRWATADIVELANPGDRRNEGLLVRVPYDERDDLCLVIVRYSGVVATLWLNERTDKHATLDRSRYAKPD